MTANVTQVFLTEESWKKVVADAFRALKPGGHFIFDTRNRKLMFMEIGNLIKQLYKQNLLFLTV